MILVKLGYFWEWMRELLIIILDNRYELGR